jgi:acetoin utilization protein AcuB
MTVRELMTRPVLTIDAGASGHEAVSRMCRSRVRHLPVVGPDGEPLGVVTDRDLRHYLFAPGVFERIGSAPVEGLLRETSVDRIMTAPPISIDAAASLDEAAALMRARKVGSLLVVDGGHVVGILTEIDLLRHICGASRPGVLTELDVVVSYP